MPDPRHHPLLCEIDQQYRQANGGLPIPNPGRTAKALKSFLDENPHWPIDRLVSCVIYRFRSRGLNLAAPPHLWIKLLPSFAAGPLDEWGKPLQATGGRQQVTGKQKQAIGNREKILEYLR